MDLSTSELVNLRTCGLVMLICEFVFVNLSI